MHKILILAAALLLSAFTSFAQTSREEVCANLNKAGGVYLAYPEPAGRPTSAPKGYQPFYISHYGRHGSRYLIADRDYRWVWETLAQADSAHALTPLGQDVLERLARLWPLVRGHGGDLSSVGVRQHQGIAQRMVRDFPEVFRGGRRVSARSTIVMRCAMSMVAFGDRIKGLVPGIDISYEASEKYMSYMNFHTDSSNVFTDGTTGPWVTAYRQFESRMVQPDRFVKSLFASDEYVRHYVDSGSLMWGFYWIAVDMQDIDTDISFYDIFTPEELFSLWQCVNYRFYVGNANHKDGNGIVMANAKPLLRNIIECADTAIADGHVAATLRFGHDGNIIPLLALMQVEHYDVAVSNPADVYKVWCDFKAAPMAANLQLVFYRNAQGNVIVRLRHNEQDVHIPVKTSRFPFYEWKDVRSFFEGRVK